jgi:hypothetical protein
VGNPTININTNNYIKAVINEVAETIHGEGEEPRMEPLSTLLDLADDYSMLELIEILQLIAECDSQEKDACDNCREQSAWISLQLQEVLAKYDIRFPRNAVSKINSGMVEV